MNNVVSRADAFNWSIAKIAEFMGMDRKTVSRKIRESGIQPAGERGGYAVYQAREVVKILLAPKVSPGADADLDKYPEARKAWYQSENERLKFETATRQLIPSSEVARALAHMAKAFASALESFPDVLERDAGLPAESRPVIQTVCDGARERTFEAIVQFELGEDGEPE